VEKFITNSQSAEQYQINVGGKFEPLLALDDDDEMSIEELYSQSKEITNVATKEQVGYRIWKLVEGMSPDLEMLCEKRRSMRLKYLT